LPKTNKNAAVVNFETNLKMIEALANAFGCTKEHRKIKETICSQDYFIRLFNI
jgi:hypothetical protein